ncbi:hypothetical protein D3C76_1403240 [compost metagenome]
MMARMVLLSLARINGMLGLVSFASAIISAYISLSFSSQKSLEIFQQCRIKCISLATVALRLPPSSLIEAPERNLYVRNISTNEHGVPFGQVTENVAPIVLFLGMKHPEVES